MPRDQIFMGAAMALVCLVGLQNGNWILANTGKGRWLVERMGDARARVVLRLVLVVGVVAGALLAADIIRPLRWG